MRPPLDFALAFDGEPSHAAVARRLCFGGLVQVNQSIHEAHRLLWSSIDPFSFSMLHQSLVAFSLATLIGIALGAAFQLCSQLDSCFLLSARLLGLRRARVRLFVSFQSNYICGLAFLDN